VTSRDPADSPGWVLPSSTDPRRTIGGLRRGYARELCRLLAGWPQRTPALAHVGGRLSALLGSMPQAMLEVLCDGSLGVLLLTGRCEPAVALLAFELGWRRQLAGEVRFEGARAIEGLWSTRRNLRIAFSPEVREVTVGDGFMRVAAAASELVLHFENDGEALRQLVHPLATGSAPFPRIEGKVALALYDPNPLAALETHPEKQGNALDLGGREPEQWMQTLRSALRLVASAVPALYAEMQEHLQLVVPVGYEPERHLSASYREYAGAVYVTLHPSPLTVAEALIHEFQHNKLNLLTHLDPVLVNGQTSLHASPVRPDQRPLIGILLAAHAFVAVAELYRRLYVAGAREGSLVSRLAAVTDSNEEALDVLRREARPTDVGRRLLLELETLHALHQRFARDIGRPL
jgi:HEXXH motif-containing protein